MRPKVDPVDVIAARQHGVISIAQLLAAGLSRSGVARRVRKRMLFREHQGVFRVGHRAPSTTARYMAAVIACGDGAFLSGLAAAHLFGLVSRPEPGPVVTAPGHRRVPGVATHRARDIDPRDVTLHHGIPIANVPRTLLDLAATVPPAELAYAAHQAQTRHHVSHREVDAVLARHPRAPGRAHLRALFHGDAPITLSHLEREFLAVLRAEGLPLPETNRPASGRHVDCRWPSHRVTIELDSYRFHRSRHTWELDRQREREARARGDEFRRYTYGDVVEDRRLMLAELRGLLGDGGKAAKPPDSPQ